MNILILYTGGLGAGRTFSYEMARGFCENGHEVYAILANVREDKGNWISLLGEERIYFFEGHKSASDFFLKWVTLPCHAGKEIRRKFRAVEFDMVIKTMYHIWSDRMLSFVSCRRVVSICHDPLPHSSTKRYVSYLSKRFTQNSDDVIVLTKSFIPIVESRHGIAREHIHYMPHGRFSGYTANTEKRLVNFQEGKTNFVFFGRIQKYKGIGVLLEAYGRLRKSHDDITLTIAGNGDMDPYQGLLGDETITVINRFIDDDEVGSLFDGTNAVLVVPYIDATQSGVILIAFEYGVPVVATDTGGLREQLNDGRIGILCKPDDVDSLQAAMESVIGNKGLMEEQKRKMQEYLHELDWNVLTAKLVEEIAGR